MIDNEGLRRIVSARFDMDDSFLTVHRFSMFISFSCFCCNVRRKGRSVCGRSVFGRMGEGASLRSVRAGTQERTRFVLRVVRFRLGKMFPASQHSPLANGADSAVASQPRIDAFTVIGCKNSTIITTICLKNPNFDFLGRKNHPSNDTSVTLITNY